MPTPFGVTALVSRARAPRLVAALPLLAIVASPVLAKPQPAASKKPAAKVDALPTLWIGPKPARANVPATSSAPVRAEAPAARVPELLSAPQPAAAPAPAKSVEAAAPRVAPVTAKAPDTNEAPTAENPTALTNTKPLIFKPAPAAMAPKAAKVSKPAAPQVRTARAAAPVKRMPISLKVAAPVAAEPKPVVAPQPAPAPIAKEAPQDLDDMPLSSVLSKNTAGEGKSQRSTGGMVADVLTKLGFVLLLGVGAAAAWKKFQGQSFARPAKPQATAEVSSVVALGPQRSVHLLRIGNQTLVVASTPQNVSLLATIDDSQAAEGGLLADEVNESADFQALIGHLVQGGAVQPQDKVEPVKVDTVEETGGRVYTGLKGSLFSAATPVAGSRADA